MPCNIYCIQIASVVNILYCSAVTKMAGEMVCMTQFYKCHEEIIILCDMCGLVDSMVYVMKAQHG